MKSAFQGRIFVGIAAAAAIAWGASAPQARAGFYCQLYSGPLPDQSVTSDSSLKAWLNQSDASNVTGNFKLVGDFETGANNNLIFKNADGSTDKTFPFNSSAIPGSGDGESGCALVTQSASCNGDNFKGSDFGNCVPFSCYSSSIWNHLSSLPVPHDMTAETLDTPVYVLSQNSNSSWAARSALFLAGSDCKDIAASANFGWYAGKGTLLNYLQSIAKTQNAPAAVVDEGDVNAGAASDSQDAPPGQDVGGPAAGGSPAQAGGDAH